jgi:hypothetical protein
VVVQDLVWVLFWSPRLEKNILIELWKPSPSFPPLKYLIPSLNLTMLLCPSINWLKMPMSVWSLITKPYTIFALEL